MSIEMSSHKSEQPVQTTLFFFSSGIAKEPIFLRLDFYRVSWAIDFAYPTVRFWWYISPAFIDAQDLAFAILQGVDILIRERLVRRLSTQAFLAETGINWTRDHAHATAITRVLV